MEKLSPDLELQIKALIDRAVYQTVDERLANGWGQWSEYVVANIKELKHGQEEVLQHCNKLEIQIEVLKAELKIKSGVWGLLGGIIPIAIGLGIWLLQVVLK